MRVSRLVSVNSVHCWLRMYPSPFKFSPLSLTDLPMSSQSSPPSTRVKASFYRPPLHTHSQCLPESVTDKRTGASTNASSQVCTFLCINTASPLLSCNRIHIHRSMKRSCLCIRSLLPPVNSPSWVLYRLITQIGLKYYRG